MGHNYEVLIFFKNNNNNKKKIDKLNRPTLNTDSKLKLNWIRTKFIE